MIEILPHIERVLDGARVAPSRGNRQPWRFAVEGERISFCVDPVRDPSPMNAGGRMARIAIGAALECALIRAGRMGAVVRFEAPRPNALVTITVTSPKRDPEPDKAIVRRATNRRSYDARPVDDATFAWMREATPPLESVRTHWFGRERVRVLGPVVEEGEGLFIASERIREAALGDMRFDARDRDEVAYGISLGALELSAAERVLYDALRRAPLDRAPSAGDVKKIGARARRLLESASGIAILTAPREPNPQDDVNVGRCMQRAWLALTRRGMVAQPMSSIPALEAILDFGDEATPIASSDSERFAALVATFRGVFPSVDRTSRIAFLMRFGWAPAPTMRAGRLPLADSVDGPSTTSEEHPMTRSAEDGDPAARA